MRSKEGHMMVRELEHMIERMVHRNLESEGGLSNEANPFEQ